MCLHVLTKTLPFKFIGVALRLLNSQLVQWIGEIIVLFSDTSMKFSKFSLWNIFSYRAISDFSWEKN